MSQRPVEVVTGYILLYESSDIRDNKGLDPPGNVVMLAKLLLVAEILYVYNLVVSQAIVCPVVLPHLPLSVLQEMGLHHRRLLSSPG